MSRITPPKIGTDAPLTPERPPAAVTGILAMLQTWQDLGDLRRVGRAARPPGPAGELALERPRHAEGPPVPDCLADLARRRRSPRRCGVSRSTIVPVTPTRPRVGWALAVAAPSGKAIGGVGTPGPGSMSPRRSRHAGIMPRASAARSGLRQMGRRCVRGPQRRGSSDTDAARAARRSSPAPAAIRSPTSSAAVGGIVAAEEAGPGPARQHVVDRAGHLVADGERRPRPGGRAGRRPAARPRDGSAWMAAIRARASPP